jgi:hypothetical protein
VRLNRAISSLKLAGKLKLSLATNLFRPAKRLDVSGKPDPRKSLMLLVEKPSASAKLNPRRLSGPGEKLGARAKLRPRELLRPEERLGAWVKLSLVKRSSMGNMNLTR